MTRSLIAVAFAAAIGLTGPGCSTSPESESERADLDGDVREALDKFRAADPTLQDLLDRSAGYAVFPEVGKGGAIVGAAYGQGEVFEKGLKVGYSDIREGTIGLQLGGQQFAELIVFTSQPRLDEFKTGDFTFSSNVSAVAITSGAGAKADFSSGLVVFITGQKGLMAEASVGGQKFRYRPM